jgi:hypothetical protein
MQWRRFVISVSSKSREAEVCCSSRVCAIEVSCVFFKEKFEIGSNFVAVAMPLITFNGPFAAAARSEPEKAHQHSALPALRHERLPKFQPRSFPPHQGGYA